MIDLPPPPGESNNEQNDASDFTAMIDLPPPPGDVRQSDSAPGSASTEVLADEIPSTDISLDSLDPLLTALENPTRTHYDHTPQPPTPPSTWPTTLSLNQQLSELAEHPELRQWCEEVVPELRQLENVVGLDAVEVVSILQSLDRQVQMGAKRLKQLEYGELRLNLARVLYSLKKRLDVWHPISQIAQEKDSGTRTTAARQAAIRSNLTATLALLDHTDHRDGWNKYLMLEELHDLSSAKNPSPRRCSQVAQRAIQRFQSERLTARQQDFLSKRPFVQLVDQLKPWAIGSLNYQTLLIRMEKYDQGGSRDDAQHFAAQCRLLRLASDPNRKTLSRHLDGHFRNANVRVAASGKLLNQFLPAPRPVKNSVRDNVLGTDVRGSSWTTTRIVLRLLPDPHRIHLAIEASGTVSSVTHGENGPVRTRNRGKSSFTGRKSLVFDRSGQHSRQAVVRANSRNDVVQLETDFDSVPLLRYMARSMAESEISQRRAQTSRLINRRVANAVQERMDAEVHECITQLQDRLKRRALDPLQKLDVPVTPISLQTTDQRVIARFRIAGNNQLAAHTPRPQAPSDSQLSIQVHESAWNNIFQKLDLEGKQFALEDLYRVIPEKLGRKPAEVPDDLPVDMTVKFATKEALRVQCGPGRMLVRLRLARLARGRGNRWHRLTAQAYYRPEVSGENVKLVRDGTIELIGDRLSIGDQVTLRGIFGKVFSKNRPLIIINQQVVRDAHMSDLIVHQCVVRDGWLGLAWGPPRQANMNVARKSTAAPAN